MKTSGGMTMRYENEHSSSKADFSPNEPLPFDPNTGFATDFLNQYNELKMALEMVPSMPEILDDFQNWAPKSYLNYFQTSECRDKLAIIQAFQSLPRYKRDALDELVASTNQQCTTALKEIFKSIDEAAMIMRCAAALKELNSCLDNITQGMQGQKADLDQSEIDNLFVA